MRFDDLYVCKKGRERERKCFFFEDILQSLSRGRSENATNQEVVLALAASFFSNTLLERE